MRKHSYVLPRILVELFTDKANMTLCFRVEENGIKFKQCDIPPLTGTEKKKDVTAFVFSAYPRCAGIHVSNGTDSSGNHVSNAWCDWDANSGKHDRPTCNKCYKAFFKTLDDPYCYQVP
ncbi:hypothetical protein O181_027658 [Austropuccinia psidii MF-1]|uniref:Uncharacterized protein n=1 Tax=Austropuccinia psidii MF-1 TaxID=1389203 RepID=A0A9Q3H145_9BASI|nr:hypothetical protein [Austropuccinia psidii MF-1]